MKQTDRTDLASMGALGMISGAVSWGLIMLTSSSRLNTIRGGAEFGMIEVRILPGLIYGLVIGFLWHRRGVLSQRGVLGYGIAAAIAHFLAMEFALHTFDQWPGISENPALVLSGVIAGFIGCCVLGVALAFLRGLPARSALGLPVLVGAGLGALLPLINLSNDSIGIGWLVFYVLWQGGYAASSARLVPASAAISANPG